MKTKRSQSNGVVRKAPPKRKGSWLESFARKCMRENEAHDRWLANMAAKMVCHYNKRERGLEEWDSDTAVDFFIRDLFDDDPEAMRRVVIQCIDWLKGIHGIRLTKKEALID